QLPGRPAQQAADVDLPGAGPAEEAGEELSEGVRAVALRTCEPAGHGHPFRRPRMDPASAGRSRNLRGPGARSLLDVPVRTRVPDRPAVTHAHAAYRAYAPLCRVRRTRRTPSHDRRGAARQGGA